MQEFLMRPMSILPCSRQISFVRALNCYLYDDSGRDYLDTFAANGNVVAGHACSAVVSAYSQPDADSVEKLFAFLQSLLPGYLEIFRLCNSGTQAVKTACQVSRNFRQKPLVLAISEDIITNSFLVLSASEDENFTPVFSIDTHFELVSHTQHHEPVVGHDKISTLGKTCKGACLCSLESFFADLADQTAAIIIEPSIGVGGSIEPCRSFFNKLRHFCDNNGIDLIANETQCGLGRTGSRMFGFQLLNIAPDIICLGANLANGYPIGAAIFCDRFAELTQNRSCANISSCAAAIATLDTIISKNLMRRSEQLGNFMKNRLSDSLENHFLVKSIRGLGLMLEIELADQQYAAEIHKQTCSRGLITGTGSVRHNIVRLTPPLVFNDEMAELTCKILEETINSL